MEVFHLEPAPKRSEAITIKWLDIVSTVTFGSFEPFALEPVAECAAKHTDRYVRDEFASHHAGRWPVRVS